MKSSESGINKKLFFLFHNRYRINGEIISSELCIIVIEDLTSNIIELSYVNHLVVIVV